MTMTIALAAHALAAAVWVGGMFFAYMALRPAAGPLPPADRLPLWRRSFARFFRWVWAAIAVLLVTGYWIIFGEWGGFAAAGVHVHIMQTLGIIMMLLFLHIWFAPYRRLQRGLNAGDLAAAGRALDQIRRFVAINLALGLAVIAVGASGRHWG